LYWKNAKGRGEGEFSSAVWERGAALFIAEGPGNGQRLEIRKSTTAPTNT